MKNALILHGTGANPDANWFPWLKELLESRGYDVVVPALPNSAKPDIGAYKKHVNRTCNFDFNEETLIIGHSSGAVAALHLLEDVKVQYRRQY